MYPAVYPPCGPGSIPGYGRVFQGTIPGLITCIALYTVEGVPKSQTRLEPAWLNPLSVVPNNIRKPRRKAEVHPRTDNG